MIAHVAARRSAFTALVLGLCLTIHPISSIAMPVEASTPDPKALVARAARTMRTIQSLSVVGDMQMKSGAQRSSAHITGVCDVSAAPPRDPMGRGDLFPKARAHFLGRFGTQGKTTTFDQRFIVIGNGKKLRVWERSGHTHNRWKENPQEGVAAFTSDLCSILFMSKGSLIQEKPTFPP